MSRELPPLNPHHRLPKILHWTPPQIMTIMAAPRRGWFAVSDLGLEAHIDGLAQRRAMIKFCDNNFMLRKPEKPIDEFPMGRKRNRYLYRVTSKGLEFREMILETALREEQDRMYLELYDQ